MIVPALLPAVAVLTYLAAAAGGAPPDLTGIAALITAGIGVVGFVATAFRGRSNNKRVEEVEQAAGYVKGFDALVRRLQEEVEESREEQKAARVQWAAEKLEHLETVRSLRAELRESLAEHSVTRGKLAQLQGQIRGFLTADQWAEFRSHIE
ncbi:MAG: hypothetical protein JST59_20340 [Actinobacteria bacterium]|nr:hypothetical protein [Actinomycetota bacterium]